MKKSKRARDFELAQKSQVEKNILIAEFMGAKPRLITALGYVMDGDPFTVYDFPKSEMYPNEATFQPEYFMFHDDWNKLMWVLDKIEQLGYRSFIEKLHPDHNAHEMYFIHNVTRAAFANGARETTKKETVYEAVIDFIKRYNAKNDTK